MLTVNMLALINKAVKMHYIGFSRCDTKPRLVNYCYVLACCTIQRFNHIRITFNMKKLCILLNFGFFKQSTCTSTVNR